MKSLRPTHHAPRLEDISPRWIEMIANQRKNNPDGWLAACKNWIVPDNRIPAEQKSLRLPPVPALRETTLPTITWNSRPLSLRTGGG